MNACAERISQKGLRAPEFTPITVKEFQARAEAAQKNVFRLGSMFSEFTPAQLEQQYGSIIQFSVLSFLKLFYGLDWAV